MKAITLYQPWAGLIIYGPKRVENRSWEPGLKIGDRLAIHSGMKNVDVEARVEPHIYAVDPKCMGNAFTNGAILGDVRFGGVVRKAADLPEDQRFWFMGPIGWIFDNVRVLRSPYKMKGTQGLWDVPEDVVKVLDRLGVPAGTLVKGV